MTSTTKARTTTRSKASRPRKPAKATTTKRARRVARLHDDPARRLKAARSEWKAAKAAQAAGKPLPPTPNLDAIKTDYTVKGPGQFYKTVKAYRSKANGKSPYRDFTPEALEALVREQFDQNPAVTAVAIVTRVRATGAKLSEHRVRAVLASLRAGG